MELCGGVPRDRRDLHVHQRLHDDERGSLVDQRYDPYGELRVDDDYGQDERG